MEIITEVILEYNVVCNICGEKINAEVNRDEIIVDPCETCLQNEKED